MLFRIFLKLSIGTKEERKNTPKLVNRLAPYTEPVYSTPGGKGEGETRYLRLEKLHLAEKSPKTRALFLLADFSSEGQFVGFHFVFKKYNWPVQELFSFGLPFFLSNAAGMVDFEAPGSLGHSGLGDCM